MLNKIIKDRTRPGRYLAVKNGTSRNDCPIVHAQRNISSINKMFTNNTILMKKINKSYLQIISTSGVVRHTVNKK